MYKRQVYSRFDRLEQSEDASTLDPLVEDVMADMSVYGAAKVACENAIREGSSSHTIVRAGLIGGDGDWSGRSGYYPWRFAHPTGPDVLVPPDLAFPTALIDVEDLAAWIVHCALDRVQGTFNAAGPTTDLGSVPVSYTHLDVYKRQVEEVLQVVDRDRVQVREDGRRASEVRDREDDVRVKGCQDLLFRLTVAEVDDEEVLICLLYTSRCV